MSTTTSSSSVISTRTLIIFICVIFFIGGLAGYYGESSSGDWTSTLDDQSEFNNPRRDCIVSTKATTEDYTLREIATKCLDLPENIINCLSDESTDGQDFMTIATEAIKCFPRIPTVFRPKILQIKETWYNYHLVKQRFSQEFFSLSSDERTRFAGKPLEEIRQMSPDFDQLSEEYKFSVEYLQISHDYLTAYDKLHEHQLEEDEVKEKLDEEGRLEFEGLFDLTHV